MKKVEEKVSQKTNSRWHYEKKEFFYKGFLFIGVDE